MASTCPSARAVADEAVTAETVAIHTISRGTYGTPRIHAESRLGGIRCRRKRVARQMRASGLHGIFRWRGKRTITRRHPRATTCCSGASSPTLRAGSCRPTSPEHPTREGKVYCAAVLDVCGASDRGA